MKSARGYSEQRKQNCDSHKYCEHQHYKKCYKQRQREISYTIFPEQNLYAPTNPHIKSLNQKTLNFETLAYEKFVQGKQPEGDYQRNFVRNYYLQNIPSKMQMTNQIVKQLEEEVQPQNAYNLAQGASKDYLAFQYKRQQNLISAQRRAQANSNIFAQLNKDDTYAKMIEREQWIQKITFTLQQLGEKIFGLNPANKQNEIQNGKQRLFLHQKSYVNQKYIKEYQIQDPEASKKIFEDLRAVMLIKKKRLEDQRIQSKNVDMNMSQISETGSQTNTASQSMMSILSQADRQDSIIKIVSELCDFDKLKKKWKTLDVDRIKKIILLTLSRKIILNCEMEKTKRVSRHERQYKSIPSKLQVSKDVKKGKRSVTTSKKDQKQVNIVSMTKLSDKELETKQDLMKTGRFDAAGEKYQRTRNFSQLFKKKEKDLKMNVSFTQEIMSSREGSSYYLPKRQESSVKDEETMKGYRTSRTASFRC